MHSGISAVQHRLVEDRLRVARNDSPWCGCIAVWARACASLDVDATAPSGGLGDAMTAAVAHRDAEGLCLLDCLIEINPPFDPAHATREIAATLKSYGITKVIGDRYSANWPRSLR